MAPTFRLHWLRESGCDAGTPIQAGELDPAIAQRVMELAGDDPEIHLQLPFLDRREWRRRSELLRSLKFVREGNEIRTVLDPGPNTRDRAATLALTHPDWKAAPKERDPQYFQVWQQVALALQRSLRTWIPEIYFRNVSRYEDRDAAFPLVVYEASRICYGRPRTEFTYDVSDPETLPLALRMIGRSLQTVLERISKQLFVAGRPELARRYAPVWHEDILGAVRRRPKKLISVLADEAALVNAVIDLGTVRDVDAVRRFSRAANLALRNTYDEDMRPLGVKALEEATRQLSHRTKTTVISGSAMQGFRGALEPASDTFDRTAYLL